MVKHEEYAACPEKETKRGRVKWFNLEKGYGFIEIESRRDIFVQFSMMPLETRENLVVGAEIEFSDEVYRMV